MCEGGSERNSWKVIREAKLREGSLPHEGGRKQKRVEQGDEGLREEKRGREREGESLIHVKVEFLGFFSLRFHSRGKKKGKNRIREFNLASI